MKNFEQHPSHDSDRSQADFEARLRNIRPRTVRFDAQDILSRQTAPTVAGVPPQKPLRSFWSTIAVAWGIGMVMGGYLMWLLNDYWQDKPVGQMVSHQTESMAEVPSQRSNGAEEVAALKETDASETNLLQPRGVSSATQNINSRTILDEPFVLSTSYDDFNERTRPISAYYGLRSGRQTVKEMISLERTTSSPKLFQTNLNGRSRSSKSGGSEYQFQVNLPPPTPMVNIQGLTKQLLSETL